MVQIWSMLASRDARLAVRRAAAAADRRRRRPRGSPTPAATTTSAGRSTTRTPRRSGVSGVRAPAVPVRLLRRRVPRLVGARAGLPGEPRDRRPADLRVSWRRWPGSRPATRCALGPDPARARHHPGLRRPAGDLDGRRARPAQRPGLGRRARRTPTTTGGCTARGCRGRRRRTTHGVNAALRALVEARRGAAAPARLGRRPRCSTPATPACCCVARRHPLGPMLGAYNVTDGPAPRARPGAARARPHPRPRRGPDHRQRARAGATTPSSWRRTPPSGSPAEIPARGGVRSCRQNRRARASA